MIQGLKCQFLDKLNNKFLFKFLLSLFILPLLTQGLYAQSALEKQVYQPTTKTTKKKSTSKQTTKKAEQPKSEPKSSSKSTSTIKKKKSSKASTKGNSRSVLVTFKTTSPDQEIWSGNQKLGVTDDEAQLEKWMLRGNYLVSVKNENGDLLLKSKMISVNTTNTEFTLTNDLAVIEPQEEINTAEESIDKNETQEAIDAADKVNAILARYTDPLKTGTVTLTDWEYVLNMAQANKLNGFTAVQIEAQRWFSSGQIELSKGNYKNAYAAFVKTSEIIPDSAYPYYALGNAYLANKQVADATRAYQKTVQLNPTFALAHRKLGDIYASNNKNKEAINSYNLAIQNGFNSAAIRYDLASVFEKDKNWDGASKQLESVAAEAPSVDVYIKLGDIYAELKRSISSYEAYEKATKISPNSAAAFYKLGDVLFNAREYERSKIAFETALKLDSDGKSINVNLAKRFVREAAEKMK